MCIHVKRETARESESERETDRDRDTLTYVTCKTKVQYYMGTWTIRAMESQKRPY